MFVNPVQIAAGVLGPLAILSHVVVIVVECDVVGCNVQRYRVAEIPFLRTILVRIHVNDIARTHSADATFNIMRQARHPSVIISAVAQVISGCQGAVVFFQIFHLHGQIHFVFILVYWYVTWGLQLLTDELVLPASHRFLAGLRLQIGHVFWVNVPLIMHHLLLSAVSDAIAVWLDLRALHLSMARSLRIG